MNYYLAFAMSLVLSLILTIITKKIALKLKIVDQPDQTRKMHEKTTPLLGGMAIFLSFFTVIFLFKNNILSGSLELHHWLGVFVGAIFLMIGGLLDDKYKLNPKLQLIFPILACLSVVAGGVGIEKITGISGNLVFLNDLRIPIIAWAGQIHYFIILADLFTIIWLMGMMYTTKLLDGVDGLVSGVTAIGSFIIFLFTMTTKYFQPDIGFAALVLCASCLGFLILNWQPAKIFLGEGGSLLLGYLLGVLSIISGGKIAIALLIMGIPIMDVAWTILRRTIAGKNPFRSADRKHLHFRLLDSGLSVKKTVLFYYLFALIFGLSALFLQSNGKFVLLLVLLLIMTGIIFLFSWLDRKSRIG